MKNIKQATSLEECEALMDPCGEGDLVLWDVNNVLFAGMREKGERLQAHLLACSKLPQRLVFVDDIAINVRDVGELAQLLSIPYVGIHFRSTLLHQESALSLAELEPEMRAFEALLAELNPAT